MGLLPRSRDGSAPPHHPDTAPGRQRFKILKVVQQQPVIVCEVEYFAEEEVNSDAVSARGSRGGLQAVSQGMVTVA